MKRTTCYNFSRAFTLIELLVVLVIIGLLIALILPAVRGAVDSAKTVACMNNLRQIYLGIEMYAQDHDGRWLEPDISLTPNPGSSLRTTVIWRETKKTSIGMLCNEYIDDINALYCPVNKNDSTYVKSREDFGTSGVICFSNYVTIFYDGVSGSVEQLKYKVIVSDVYSEFQPDAQHGNGKKINRLYGDGSVKLEKKPGE